MPQGLTPEEREVIKGLYSRDVTYWEWGYWAASAAKNGRCSMGIANVLLPYRADLPLPHCRREMNELYLEALRVRAEDYGMRVEMLEGDEKGIRLFLIKDS